MSTEPFKRIALTQGKFALVSPEDFNELDLHNWCVTKGKHTFYALRSTKKATGKWTSEQMHRRIMNPTAAKEVDHINGDGLDNRRSNLRIVTRAENSMNRRRNKNSTSGFKGVYKHKNQWRVQITCDGVKYHIGLFDSLEKAATAYNLKAIELYGSFAWLNDVKKPGALPLYRKVEPWVND